MEFDYQWKHLPSPSIEYNEERVKELLRYTKMRRGYFKDKLCLDVGCGNGRWTYALMEIGANVESFDISPEAIKRCRQVNPEAYVLDLMKLEPSKRYDFVICCGVLHHLPSPIKGFVKVASQVKKQGLLYIMVYHEKTQRTYKTLRLKWKTINDEEKIKLIKRLVSERGGTLHGWYDALNPEYNWGLKPKAVKRWFRDNGFRDIKSPHKYNIHMIARAS